MTGKQAEPPENSTGDMSFADTVIRSGTVSSHAYSPNASASSIIFEELTADAQSEGTVAAVAATISTRLQGKAPGRVKIDLRAGHGFKSGLRGSLTVMDGGRRHHKKFSRSEGEIFMSWTRRAKPGEVIQLSIFATCRVTEGGANSGGLLKVESIDMVTLPAKK